MGLDSVELVLAIEEEFGVEIPDVDAEKIDTVGDMYEWLKARIATTDPRVCLSQCVFYKLRRALIDNYGLGRSSITPDTVLTDLLPRSEIEDGWPFLQMFIDIKTPPFSVANRMLGFRLNERQLSVRDLVTSLILVNEKSLPMVRDSDEGIWFRLVRVFVNQINVRPDEVKPEASIARDLGVD